MVIPSEIEHDQRVTNRAISLQSQENNLESDQVQEDKTSNHSKSRRLEQKQRCQEKSRRGDLQRTRNINKG